MVNGFRESNLSWDNPVDCVVRLDCLITSRHDSNLQVCPRLDLIPINHGIHGPDSHGKITCFILGKGTLYRVSFLRGIPFDENQKGSHCWGEGPLPFSPSLSLCIYRKIYIYIYVYVIVLHWAILRCMAANVPLKAVVQC